MEQKTGDPYSLNPPRLPSSPNPDTTACVLVSTKGTMKPLTDVEIRDECSKVWGWMEAIYGIDPFSHFESEKDIIQCCIEIIKAKEDDFQNLKYCYWDEPETTYWNDKEVATVLEQCREDLRNYTAQKRILQYADLRYHNRQQLVKE